MARAPGSSPGFLTTTRAGAGTQAGHSGQSATPSSPSPFLDFILDNMSKGQNLLDEVVSQTMLEQAKRTHPTMVPYLKIAIQRLKRMTFLGIGLDAAGQAFSAINAIAQAMRETSDQLLLQRVLNGWEVTGSCGPGGFLSGGVHVNCSPNPGNPATDNGWPAPNGTPRPPTGTEAVIATWMPIPGVTVGFPTGWARPGDVMVRTPQVAPAPAPITLPELNAGVPVGDPLAGPARQPLWGDPFSKPELKQPPPWWQGHPDVRIKALRLPVPDALGRVPPPAIPPGGTLTPSKPDKNSIKLQGAALAAMLASKVGYNLATEIRDGIQILWKNIPPEKRRFWGNPTLSRMTQDVLRNLGNIEWGPWVQNKAQLKGGRVVPLRKPREHSGALAGLGVNAVEDAFYGLMGKASTAGSMRLGHAVDTIGRTDTNVTGALGDAAPGSLIDGIAKGLGWKP